MKLKSSRNKVASILCALAIFLLAGWKYAAIQFKPDVDSLWSLATKVIPISGAYPEYWWLSDHELLRFRDPAHRDDTFVRYDTTAHTETPLTALTEIYRRSQGKMDTVHLSPDGTRLLWTGDSNITYVATMDAKDCQQVKQNTPSLNVWLSDSTRWAELSQAGRYYDSAFIRSRKEPQKLVKLIPVAAPFDNDARVVNLRHLTPDFEDHILVPYWNGAPFKVQKVKLSITGFGANPMLAKQLNCYAPHESERGDVSLSGDNGKMAWVLEYYEPFPKFMRDMSISEPKPGKYLSTGLWVNNVFSNKLYVVGSVPTVRGDTNSGPFNVQFTPDGSRLSFVYHNTLWTVPAE